MTTSTATHISPVHGGLPRPSTASSPASAASATCLRRLPALEVNEIDRTTLYRIARRHALAAHRADGQGRLPTACSRAARSSAAGKLWAWTIPIVLPVTDAEAATLRERQGGRADSRRRGLRQAARQGRLRLGQGGVRRQGLRHRRAPTTPARACGLGDPRTQARRRADHARLRTTTRGRSRSASCRRCRRATLIERKRLRADGRLPDAQPAAPRARVRARLRRRGDPARDRQEDRRDPQPARRPAQGRRRAGRRAHEDLRGARRGPLPRPGRHGRGALEEDGPGPERTARADRPRHAHVLRRPERGGDARDLPPEPGLHALHHRPQARRRALRRQDGDLGRLRRAGDLRRSSAARSRSRPSTSASRPTSRSSAASAWSPTTRARRRSTISGTKMREMLDKGEMPDARVMRPSTAKVLAAYYAPAEAVLGRSDDDGTLRSLQEEAGRADQGAAAAGPAPVVRPAPARRTRSRRPRTTSSS